MNVKAEVRRLVEAGYHYIVAEALAESDITVESAKLLSADEVFERYLTWNGIIGYHGLIARALDNARKMNGGAPCE